MSYPNWAPPLLVERVAAYKDFPADGEKWSTFDLEYQLWQRLITRPEMESVWALVAKTAGLDTLTTNGGLTGKLDRAIRHFHTSPRLSPGDYKTEMIEIEAIANQLANKLKKYCDAAEVYNPFPPASLLTPSQIERFAWGFDVPQENHRERINLLYQLNDCLPLIDAQLKGLAKRASEEAENQGSRLRLPRKVNDQNLFRTYFIHAVCDYFFLSCADYSPARIATFCSVALDDASVSPDLVRKVHPLDPDSRYLLEIHKSGIDPED